MFWHMSSLSAPSPLETILDRDTFTLEELFDEDEIIQECKAVNGRLINFLRQKAQIKQLVEYIVQEAPENAPRQRIFKFPFIACEIFTCEIDIILKSLVEDEELMDLLFSFLDPERSHSNLLAGYFSKVVICLLTRKTVPLMGYIQAHREDILKKLVALIGITSVMEVLIRLLGADEYIYSNYPDAMQWLENTNVLEMIVDIFSSSDCPEVHGNVAETLCAISRYAPPVLASKISCSSFIGKLFCHALQESRPNSVLVNVLSVCISLLDPKRVTAGMYYTYNRQMDQGPGPVVNPEVVEGMLKSLGDLLKLLDPSSDDKVLLTTYGRLQPPLGKHRLKVVEFIMVLVSVSNEVAEKELIRLGAVKRIIELLFEYPFNNFLHHHVERIVVSCLESKNSQFVEHVLCDCNLLGKILEVENNPKLDSNKPALPDEARPPPRIGNIGHLTRIANKLVHLANSNTNIQKILQENSDWINWQTNVLLKRNAVENVFQWSCGRPTSLHDRTRDSDDDDYQDRDYDVAALADSLSQAFRHGAYDNDDTEEAHSSLERDDKDVYADNESSKEAISSLRSGDDQESASLFTNSNWFAFDDERAGGPSTSLSSQNLEDHKDLDEVTIHDDEDLPATATTVPVTLEKTLEEVAVVGKSSELRPTDTGEPDKSPEWVEWRETSVSADVPPNTHSEEELSSTATRSPSLPDREVLIASDDETHDVPSDKKDVDNDASADNIKTDGGKTSLDSQEVESGDKTLQLGEFSERNVDIEEVDCLAKAKEDSSKLEESEKSN